MTPRTTAIIYIRKSLVKSTGIDPASPEMQEQECRLLAAKNNWQVEVFSDAEGHRSGKTDKRPGYQALLARAQLPDVAAIIVYKYSRLARNTRLLLQLVDTLAKLGVQLISVANAIDASTAQGRMMLTIVSSFDEMYSNEMSDTRKEQIEFMRREKGRHYGLAPFGSVRQEQNGDLVLVPSTASQPNGTDHDALTHLYKLYTEQHLSVRVIAVQLNATGWQYRDRHGQLRNWTDDDVRRAIASHWIYAGYVTIGRAYRDQEEIIPGSHAPLLPDTLTAPAAARMATNFSLRGLGKRPAAQYPLTNLIACAQCGSSLRGKTDDDRRYYIHPLPVDHKATWPALAIEEAIRQHLAAIQLPENIAHQSAALFNEYTRAQQNAPVATAAQHHLDIALERLTEIYTEGHLTRAQYDARRAAYLAQRPTLPAAAPIQPAFYNAVPLSLVALHCTPARLRELTRALYAHITLTPTRPFTITYTPHPWAAAFA